MNTEKNEIGRSASLPAVAGRLGAAAVAIVRPAPTGCRLAEDREQVRGLDDEVIVILDAKLGAGVRGKGDDVAHGDLDQVGLITDGDLAALRLPCRASMPAPAKGVA